MTAQTEAVDFFAFDNSYARLPDRFFSRLQPTPVAAPRLIRLNKKLAWDLELDPEKLAAPDGVEILAGNRLPKGGGRSPWLMRATSSGVLYLNLVTGVPFFSAR